MQANTIRELFDAAMQLPSDARQAWLDAQSLDESTASRVRALIAAVGDETSVLDRPFAEHMHSLAQPQNKQQILELIGTEIDGYRIVSLLGQGGMASVFSAERLGADFEQLVAIKLLRRSLHSELELRLFQRERQALASLEHPNIARLLDGGVTSSGVPYLVMELVQGMDLLSYARQNSLSLRARLALFAQVCDAVNAAHRALIVHRDIKPGNILVNQDGQAKLLDFGIAKILNEQDSEKATTYAPLTPEYAAPEQFDGRAITTATDVYGLGVVLHELLLGIRPKRGDTLRASDLITRESTTQPATPITRGELRRFLRGDIDNILRQSLNPEPNERYASAGDLAADLRRFLDGLPVQAHPPSGWYRTSKFIRRNRGAVLLAGLSLLAVLGSSIYATSQAIEARAQAARANQITQYLIDVFASVEPGTLPEDRLPPSDLIATASQRLLREDDLPIATRAALQDVLARVALGIGTNAQALALAEARLAQAQIDERPQAALLVAQVHLADDRPAAARTILEPFSDGIQHAGELKALMTLAHIYSTQGDTEQLKAAASMMARYHDLLVDFKGTPAEAFMHRVAEALYWSDLREFERALPLAEEAISYASANNLKPTPALFDLHIAIGAAAPAVGQPERSIAAYEDAIALSDRMYTPPHRAQASARALLGSLLVSRGEIARAEPLLLEALEVRLRVLGERHSETLLALGALARLRLAQRRYQEAYVFLHQIIDACALRVTQITACVTARVSLSRGLFLEQKPIEARPFIDEAVALQEKMAGATSPFLIFPLTNLAEQQAAAGEYDTAIKTVQRIESIASQKGGYRSDVLTARSYRARAWLGLDQAQRCADELAIVEPEFSALVPKFTGMRIGMLRTRAECARHLGQTSAAAAFAAQALLIDPSKINPKLRAQLEEMVDAAK